MAVIQMEDIKGLTKDTSQPSEDSNTYPVCLFAYMHKSAYMHFCSLRLWNLFVAIAFFYHQNNTKASICTFHKL